MNKEKIIGKRIYLRILSENDASEDYCKWLADPIVNQYLDTRKVTIDDLKKYINEKNEKEGCFLFGIFDITNERHIGNVKIEMSSEDKGLGLFGILIGERDYWGKGIGTEATRLILRYGFKDLGLDTVELGVVSENKPAIRVYEKVGFKTIRTEKKTFEGEDKTFERVVMRIDKKDYFNVLAIIQARMGSTRFPGKMMAELSGKPLIKHVIDRVRRAKKVDMIALATGDGNENQVLVDEVTKMGVPAFAGDEDDVLDRYYNCAKKYQGDIIIRITGDCPLIDPEILDKVIEIYDGVDYASNVMPPTFPDGMDVEVFSFSALEKAWKESKLKSEREHVTPYIWKNKNLFKQANLNNDEDLSEYRLTVDERQDLELIREILKKMDNEKFNLADIMEVLKSNPELLEINYGFERNEGYQKSLKEDKNES